MDALVIGAGGFVGKYLLRQLLEEGADPGATKLPGERIGIDGVEESDLDLSSQSAVRTLLAAHRPSHIYHLAAQSSVSVSWKKPEETIDVNIKGTLHLLDAIRSIESNVANIQPDPAFDIDLSADEEKDVDEVLKGFESTQPFSV